MKLNTLEVIVISFILISFSKFSSQKCPKVKSKGCTCENINDRMQVTCLRLDVSTLENSLKVYQNSNVHNLILKFNAISNLTSEVFKDMKVKNIQLHYNRIKYVSDNAFKDLAFELESLGIVEFFWTNFLFTTFSQIPSKAVSQLINLKTLNITSAHIYTIPSYSFKNLKYLKSLKVSGYSIQSIKSFAFDGLSTLEVLTIHSNMLSIVTKNVFGGLENLKALNLHSPKLKIIVTDVFVLLKSLTILNLNHSIINKIEDKAFDGIKNSLESLFLMGNDFSAVPESLNNIYKLKTLDISNNHLLEISDSSLNGLSSLERLSLKKNVIKIIHSSVLKDSYKLKFFDLTSNRLASVPATVLRNMLNLEEISFKMNKIQEVNSFSFFQNKKLKRLDFSYNRIKKIQIHAFKSLEDSLEELDLSRNEITDLHPDILSNIKSLKILKLNKNNLTNINVRLLEGFEDRLQVLDLTNNPWHCDCKMRAFREWYLAWEEGISHSQKYRMKTLLNNAKCETPKELSKVPLLYPPIEAFQCGKKIIYNFKVDKKTNNVVKEDKKSFCNEKCFYYAKQAWVLAVINFLILIIVAIFITVKYAKKFIDKNISIPPIKFKNDKSEDKQVITNNAFAMNKQ